MYRVYIYLLFSLSLSGQIIFTELMYNPAGSDSPNEFVEIYNNSNSAVDISGWKIADLAASDNLLDSAGHDSLSLPAHTFGLIMEADYDGSMYQGLIPDSAVVIFTHTTTIGNNLGNTTDSLFLIDTAGAIITATGWAQPTPAGYSRERIRFAWPDAAVNWALSQDSLGTPGTVNSVRPRSIDGALLSDSTTLDPAVIWPGAGTTLTALVANVGRQTFSGQLLIVNDSVVFSSTQIPDLGELDTGRITINLNEDISGNHNWQVRLGIPGDEDVFNNSDSVTLGVRYLAGSLALNEFLPDPGSGQQEFVELIHLGTAAINLENWLINDNNTGMGHRFPNISIKPGALIVIAADSGIAEACPPDAIYIVPLTGFPSLNNSGDQIRLFDPYNTLIDSLTYDSNWNLQRGRSQEKIQPYLSSDDPANWQVTTDSSGCTPGRLNSITPQLIDGRIIPDMIQFEPLHPEADQPLQMTVCVTNAGIDQITPQLSVSETGLEIGRFSVPSLAAVDTTCVQFQLPGCSAGVHTIDLYLDLAGDQIQVDNHATVLLSVSYQFGSVRINEFLAQPAANRTEFIELVSFENFNLSNWGISDNSGSIRQLPAHQTQPGNYLLLAPDSTWLSLISETVNLIVPVAGWPTLNNSTDAIFLFDQTGKIIDSLQYADNWFLSPGRSLEKLRPELKSADFLNWSTAVNSDGFTPGRSNSIYIESAPSNGKVFYAPNPFSPDADGFEDQLVIHYQLPYELAYLKLEIFDSIGRDIAKPGWNVPVAREGILTWDGYCSTGKRARVGIYIIKLTAADQRTSQTWEDVQTVVLAKKL